MSISLKVSMVHLAVRMHCNWPTDHAIDHSSIGLNRLTIQLVFNEVSLFTFSDWTHGFDVTVPKNYLKSNIVSGTLILNSSLRMSTRLQLTVLFNISFLLILSGTHCTLVEPLLDQHFWPWRGVDCPSEHDCPGFERKVTAQKSAFESEKTICDITEKLSCIF